MIMVYYYLHPSSKFAEAIQPMTSMVQDIGDASWKISQSNQVQLIRAYIEFASTKSLKLHSALESYLENREKEGGVQKVKN